MDEVEICGEKLLVEMKDDFFMLEGYFFIYYDEEKN